ncbi:MAG: FeoA domain-containing protein [Anaerolineaceae bacterium]|nr:FeoA domain-containing protein [Anaerolineaceae bacterium]
MNSRELSLSSSMQMYLVKIKRLDSEVNPVPLSLLAESLQISPVSANEMCRKLDEMELIQYQPYKGASLTIEGNLRAEKILRRHRLWEVFLVEKLHFDSLTAHQMADDLEHATSKELADQLNKFLGCPKFNPEGKEIPAGDKASRKIQTIKLSEMGVGSEGYYFSDELDKNIAEFFSDVNLKKGERLKVLGKTSSQMIIQVEDEFIHISKEIAEKIAVAELETRASNNGKTSTVKKTNKEKTMRKKIIKKITLKDLKIGQSGVVVHIKGKGSIKQRMMDMGLVSGSEVKVIRVAPLGDPIEIRLKGYNLSLRKSEAQDIEIEISGENE